MSLRIVEYFKEIEDPRRPGYSQRHKFIDIITIAICAAISDADTWVEVSEYGKSKEDWFKTFLELPNGIPSHDVFTDVFGAINPESFEKAFLEWIKNIAELTHGEIIAIDGKTVRRSYDKEDNRAAIHMVSAWANTNKIVLGQIKTDDKSNEITAIPKLLDTLAIQDCIGTIDAMGCQKNIAAKIIENEADYVLALKGNQSSLQEEVIPYFDGKIQKKDGYDYYETIEKDHGRIETRKCLVTSDIDWILQKHPWSGLKSIGVIESTREIGDQISIERRYYISSLECNAKLFAESVRGHWGIENELHWSLDVSFKEDYSRVRKDFGAQNFNILRKIALNLIKKENSKKMSVICKRKKAAWNNDYLLKVLSVS
jgi:predicted transposase YbfD/YdcC